MKMPELKPRDRRALRLGLLTLGPLMLWGWGVAPYVRALGEARESYHTETDLLQREVQMLAVADQYPAAFETGAERLLAAAERLFDGGSGGAASAAVADYVRRLAEMDGSVRLMQMEPLAVVGIGEGLSSCPLRVSGESDLEGIMTLVRLLEDGPKLVHIEQLQIRSAEGGRYGQTAQPEALSFHLVVSGYALDDGQDPQPAAGQVAHPQPSEGAGITVQLAGGDQ